MTIQDIRTQAQRLVTLHEKYEAKNAWGNPILTSDWEQVFANHQEHQVLHTALWVILEALADILEQKQKT